MSNRPTVIDLFCGAGGLSLGFEQAGAAIVVAVDSDPVHLGVHRFNFPATEHLCADIRTLRGSDLLSAAERSWNRMYPSQAFAGSVDGIVGGPSCQGFSEIGRRDVNDSRNELLLEFVRLIAEAQPKWFVLENVPGLLAPRYRELVTEFVHLAKTARYRLHGPMVLSASDFGVAQDRRRAFVIGTRGSERPMWPQQLRPPMGAAQALAGLPAPEAYESLLAGDQAVLAAADLAAFMRLTADSFVSQAGLAYPRSWNPKVVTSSRLTVHTAAVAARFAALIQGHRDRTSRLPRLAPDRPAPTLRAGTGEDHGSFTAPRPIHYASPRVITVREAARLQSFPDWFRFHATSWHGFRQVGNAVPPKLARAVATSVLHDGAVARDEVEARRPRQDDSLLNLSVGEAASYWSVPRPAPRAQRRGKAVGE